MTQTATVAASLDQADTNTNTALADYASLAGRILIAPLFLLSGVSKLTAPGPTIDMITSTGLPFATLGFVLAVLVEVVGSGALIAGYRVRLVAAAMTLYAIATAIAFHANLADQNQFFHFFKNIAMAGGLLQIVAFGAGRISLDARRR